MARNFSIKETDVYRIILEEVNDTAFSSKIEFSMADWMPFGEDAEGNPKGLLINRLALNGDQLTRFDINTTYDEETYAKSTNSFVAFSVGPLNGEITALNTIKNVVYSPVLTFLVSIDNINVQRAITIALEEVRKRLIQYQRVFKTSYHDLDNLDSTTKIEETLKVIMMSSTIDYGDIFQINGKQYLTYTMALTIQVTNFGEFANQQKIYLGVSDILDEGSIKMFPVEPNEWHWGVGRGIESVQLLPDYAEVGSTNNKEIKSVTKNKGFAFNMEMQMDFQDSSVGELCKYLYKDSMIESLTNPICTLTIEMYLYDSTSGTYLIDSDLTMTRVMELTQNQPPENLSKGEKLVHSLTLAPKYQSS
jgi:hypothetical protein